MFPYTHGVIASSLGGSGIDPNAFVFDVKTDNAGVSNNDQYKLNLKTGLTYNFDVDWGDGNSQTHTSDTAITHTYASAGTYTITITSATKEFPTIYYNNGNDKEKHILTRNFGDVGWSNMGGAFFGCVNNDLAAGCTGDFSGVTYARNAWFDNNLTSWSMDMPNCTDFYRTWRLNAFTSFDDVDLSSGTEFYQAVSACGVITSFSLRNFYAMTNGNLMFGGTTLPTSDYSDILITQNANNANTGVTFHGGSSTYNASATSARTNLVSVKTWSITDAGLV